MKYIHSGLCILFITIILSGLECRAQSDSEAGASLGQELQNPIANIISVPFQNNFDYKMGPRNGARYQLNFQPVLPVSLGENINLITRAILPLISQDNVSDFKSETGLSDALISIFISPAKSKLIWGVGPAFYMPTATDPLLGTKKWGMGPTGVVLNQHGLWTVGLLANHIWSIAGDDNRAGFSNTYFQPFFSHTNKKQFSIGMSSEDTYDWKNEKLTGGILLNISQVALAGKQALSLGISAKYYFSNPGISPSWGGRATVTLIFPKKKE